MRLERMFAVEFHEKLQKLRKEKDLTQEALAQALFVSRTAISKWESGRGFPNIDSLRQIAKFFCVTVDELLTGEEMLSVAEEECKQTKKRFCDLVFGMLDISVMMLYFLPIFAQRTNGAIREVSLFALNAASPYLKVLYIVVVSAIAVCGIFTLALQKCQNGFWLWAKSKMSILLNAFGAFLFINTLQAYAATLLFVYLIIKVFMLVKKR